MPWTRSPFVVLSAASALMLAACATPSPERRAAAAAPVAPVTSAAPVAEAPATPAAQSGGMAVAESAVGAIEAQPTAQTDAALQAGRYVYFDFDSALIRSEFKDSIDAHARQLMAEPAALLRIEGHADERGSREYNLALGQRRADAVARALQLLGVADARLETVSYGAERPKAEGSGEEAWRLNRRAELQREGATRAASLR
jgi:peptidoglycan-associated lipoprotein